MGDESITVNLGVAIKRLYTGMRGVLCNRSYGIPEGVIFGYLVTCQNGEYKIVQGLPVSEFSKSRVAATHKELLEERGAIEGLLK